MTLNTQLFQQLKLPLSLSKYKENTKLSLEAFSLIYLQTNNCIICNSVIIITSMNLNLPPSITYLLN